jgi:puromycin-sensitive aminopeptidase
LADLDEGLDTEAKYRLPKTVTPSRYDLVFEPDLESRTFTGSVDVVVQVHEPVTEIVLNALELDLSDARIVADGRTVEAGKILIDSEAQRAHLELEETADPGEWTLHIAFSGRMNPRLTGFYLSTYERDGVTYPLGSTHFESTDARRAFPCWDEPDAKAAWRVTLVVEEGLAAFSNGPEGARETLADGRTSIRFADTMPMSSYLVAFVVGRLDATDEVDVAGTPTRVVHVPGKGELARFALDIGAHSLRWFGDYYGIAYPDAKVDHVAVPDFAQGAMENLGCITYREQLLLIEPTHATQEEVLDVAETVAHELAHMWFGDLVTMRWWNGIWLNEAFATFMSHLCVDDYRPDWEVWHSFNRGRTQAFEVDCLETTRPIEFPVHSPEDANGMFDVLTYTKGGAVLRMLEQWLGPERFRDGIRRYLRKHAYGNTETHELWDALEEETGEPVRRIMDAWIFQGGYPAITVAVDEGSLRFTQRRFVPSQPEDPTTWPVPLIVRQSHGEHEQVDRILVEAEGATLPMLDPDALVVANADAISFVRTWYDEDLRGRMHAGAELSALERYTIVDDAWAAVVAGQAPVASFLDLVRGFADETDLAVWQAIVSGLGWCDRFVEGTTRERLRDFVRGLVRPTLERLGWSPGPDETDLTKQLRGALILGLAILGEDPEAQAQARELEAESRAGGDVDAAVAAAAIDVVAYVGGNEEHARYRDLARTAATPQEQERYLFGLARFSDPQLVDATLAASMTSEIRSQDAPFLVNRLMAGRDHGARAFRYVAEHWDEMLDRFASSNIIALGAGVRWLTDPSTVDEVAAFFAEHDIPQNHLMLQQALERQRVAAALRRRITPELEVYFSA